MANAFGHGAQAHRMPHSTGDNHAAACLSESVRGMQHVAAAEQQQSSIWCGEQLKSSSSSWRKQIKQVCASESVFELHNTFLGGLTQQKYVNTAA